MTPDPVEGLALGYPSAAFGRSRVVHADCFEWLARVPEHTLHAVVTDPPYGFREYDPGQLAKRADGTGGVWRIPPSFDGHRRAPLPRFTDLGPKDIEDLRRFFAGWARLAARALRPGGHVFVAGHALLSRAAFAAMADAGLEFRGEIVRLVRTLRGGDRPKNAEREFPGVCSLPRGCYEPWGLFRKPLPPRMTVADCLRAWQTGGLRRGPDGLPFPDVIASGRTPRAERAVAGHPSLKPQAFLRSLVRAALPLGAGVVADPFAGSGSTVAAAEAVGVPCVGVEQNPEYYALSLTAVPRLAALATPEPARARA